MKRTKKTKPSTLQHPGLPDAVLLDKGVVRRIYERRVRLADGRKPTDSQKESARAFNLLRRRGKRICITHQTANVLRTRPPRFAFLLLDATDELEKGVYLRRWARRLREMSFSREDGVILAYGNFGVDLNSNPVAVAMIVTTDLKLAARFNGQQAEIEARFDRMVQALSEPYSALKLPVVMTTADVLTLV